MMLLRTLVLERSDEDAPLNGALLCGFAVPRIASNFLVYSLDEETEPGSSRVYVAALRKKVDRYFLSGVDAQEDLSIAMQVFKQILTLAAAKPANNTDTQIPYHFVDLKGCKLPPARPEDHHSVIIKKALVMKVITQGASAPASAAIESATLIVPSIRFSSRMVSPPKLANTPQRAEPPSVEQLNERPMLGPIVPAPQKPMPFASPVYEPPAIAAPTEHASLFEMDTTLTSLARVAQELTVQKTAVFKQQEALEQWHGQLQQRQAELDQGCQELVNRTLEKEATLQLRDQVLEGREARVTEAFTAQQHEQHQMEAHTAALEKRAAEVYSQEVVIRQKSEKLAAMVEQLPGLRQNLYAMLLELDQALEGFAKRDE